MVAPNPLICIFALKTPGFLSRLLRHVWSSQTRADEHCGRRFIYSTPDRLLHRNNQPNPGYPSPMANIAAMEHLYERVRLVPGKGSVSKGQFCIMSFVALLAGEPHTDEPVTASPFIRCFAIALNDALPEPDRQRLKLFAPRILGTNDGLDAERAKVASRIIAEEVDPRLQVDRAAAGLPFLLQTAARMPDRKGIDAPHAFARASFPYCGLAWASCDTNAIADYAARYLISCALTIPDPHASSWYWSKAIDLLDRVCEIGRATPCSRLKPRQVECAEAKLNQCVRPHIIGRIMAGIKRRIRGALGNTAVPPDVGWIALQQGTPSSTEASRKISTEPETFA
jgi:hypothetical protein